MRNLSKILKLLTCFCLIALLFSCSPKEQYKFKYQSDRELADLLEAAQPDYPAADFIVFSDPHIYNPVLGLEGQALEDYLAVDRKLLRESAEILETAILLIKDEKADFVLVPGDLTKDGERVSHDLVANYLSQIEATGKKVYVIPGNHDINNGYACRYIKDRAEPVPSVSPGEFAQIYSNFGYAEANYRDPASLSYVAELQPQLWLLALDSCIYTEYVAEEEPVTDGRFSQATLGWIEEMLEKASREQKAVIAMLHHGIVEHYASQEKTYGEYVVDDFHAISRMLAAYNVRLVFTGHYHAQDITLASFNDTDKFAFDIETGALVTYPCPYRMIHIDASQQAAITTERIESIPSHPTGFPDFARNYILAGIKNIASYTIQEYKVGPAEAEKLASQVAEAVVAHYAGDEYLPPGQNAIETEGLSPLGWLVVIVRRDFIENQWIDLEPPDNNVTLNLKTGIWK